MIRKKLMLNNYRKSRDVWWHHAAGESAPVPDSCGLSHWPWRACKNANSPSQQQFSFSPFYLPFFFLSFSFFVVAATSNQQSRSKWRYIKISILLNSFTVSFSGLMWFNDCIILYLRNITFLSFFCRYYT